MGASQFSLTAATKKVPRAMPTILLPPSPNRHHYAHDNGIAEPNG